MNTPSSLPIQIFPLPVVSSEPIHFEGSWTEAEINRVKAAVAEAEGGGLPDVPKDGHAPWMATCHKRGPTHMYAISRVRLSTVVSAQSAAVLAEKVRAVDVPEEERVNWQDAAWRGAAGRGTAGAGAVRRDAGRWDAAGTEIGVH